MKKILICAGTITSLAAAVCLTGCSILPEPRQSRIDYFDLRYPGLIQTRPIDVEQFVTSTGERQRMLRRKEHIYMESSDFHKWMQPAGPLLTRYLRLAFRNPHQKPPVNRDACVILSGEVLAFERNGDNAVLGVRYLLKYDRQTYTGTVLITEKINSSKPAAFAEAMSRAADIFARTVAAEIAKLPGKRK